MPLKPAAVSFAVLMAILPANAADSVDVAARARSVRPGEVVELTITAPEQTRAVHLRVFDRDVPVYRVDGMTWKALVGIDLDVKVGAHVASIDAEAGPLKLHATHRLDVRAQQFPVRRLTVDPALVDPPAEELDRILAEAADLSKLWKQASPERLWDGPFVPPVPGVAGSRFGARSVYNGKPTGAHSGADFPSPVGRPVAAPNAGRIALARDLYFSGNTVVVDHGMGFFSLLAHLSVIGVREGDRVVAGQEVGRVGATGRVTGPHLHWAVRLGGARVDPLAVLAVLDRDAPPR